MLRNYGVTEFEHDGLKMKLAPAATTYADPMITREEAVSALPDNLKRAFDQLPPNYRKLGLGQ